MNKHGKYDAYQMIIFDALASTGSFTLAAERLEVSISHVSKQVKDLEQRLGVKLVKVTPRQLTLTREGALFAESCQRMIAVMDQATEQVLDSKEAIAGGVRIAMSHSLGARYMVPIAQALQARYPGLALEVTLGDCRVDMLEDDVDLWFTTSKQISPGYIAQRLYDVDFVLLASTAYLQRHGAPSHPDQLSQHNCIIYRSKTRDYHNWSFCRDGQHLDVAVSGNFVIDSAETVLDAVSSGLGIGYIADYLLPKHAGAEPLVPLLKEWRTDLTMPVYAVYPSRKALPKRFKVVIEAVRESLNHPPGR
ncbi:MULTISPECIES: LysR family transcriptional regulator [Ferrimonas]|uniref:LysR family transcriptional regulator n=1 Tax=Ferrimonas TaxID=44011 RepID=UPI00041040BD|nr:MULTISPECIES: LysR family transcriptional regulator [Ferrimonas]USD38112.1 LysR family transcriptional regulator [Ferrimonas sp. SCSIO 43195]